MSSTLSHDVEETLAKSIEGVHAGSLPANRTVQIHRYVARLLMAGIAVQFFLAGLGVFGITSFLPHVIFGTLVVVASFALPLIAWRGHLPKATQRRSWILAGLMILQGGLIDAGRVIPIISAFHPVNAMIIALVTFSLI
jgi:hypothetical protein